jgi:hypothetical protein
MAGENDLGFGAEKGDIIGYEIPSRTYAVPRSDFGVRNEKRAVGEMDADRLSSGSLELERYDLERGLRFRSLSASRTGTFSGLRLVRTSSFPPCGGPG